MDFSAPSPSSSSSDSSSYPTDEISKDTSGRVSDFGLDPSDPLNLLLHNTSQRNGNSFMDDPFSGANPADWFQLASLWPEGMKYPDMGMEFNLTLPMDMDYNPAMTVEPSALHFDQKGLSQSIFSRPPAAPPSTAVDMPTPPSDDPADEIAQRVRQSAGVMLAVPMGQHAPNQAKVPIPRLTRPKITAKVKRSTTKSGSSSASSTPPPDSTSPGNILADIIGRPKTSHTTIERRYRTNLNARIQSLRQAVPALRVLEEMGKKDTEVKEKPTTDIVDERGFVDGVKVARKCSKANVLGKAVEYIRVLKKRESRLTREQNGLKSLICGLVGGPALLREWEQEWRNKFGGAEKDEVEGEEMEPLSDDEEGDDEDGEGDDDDGRAKKKARIVKAPTKTKKPFAVPATIQAALAMAGTDNVVPEKRKRGRPRKVVPSAPEESLPLTEFAVASDGQPPAAPQQAPQYLLATFALFSFFNSPLPSSNPSSSSHPHTHSGSVLGSSSSPQPSTSTVPVAAGLGWHDVIQVFHLLVSILVFLSIVVPWLPAGLKRRGLLSYVIWPFSLLLSVRKGDQSVPAQPISPPIPRTTARRHATSFDRTALLEVLSPSCRGSVDEAEQLYSALGVSAGLLGLVQGIFGKKPRATGFEQKGLEQRAWMRLGELSVLDHTTSLASRLQTYWCACSYISFFSASASDLSTLALVVRPLSSSKASRLWGRAKKARVVRPHEKLVLESLSVDEAANQLAARPEHELKHNPIAILASMLILERIKSHSVTLFVRTILPARIEPGRVEDMGKEEKVIIDAARSLGGRTEELADMLEHVWKTGISTHDDIICEPSNEGHANAVEGEIRSLLGALILYRRIFPSSILSHSANSNGVSILLSPPPSPPRRNAALHMALRRTLGSSVFDFSAEDGKGDVAAEQSLGIALEEARDCVVDMLVDFERQSRVGS